MLWISNSSKNLNVFVPGFPFKIEKASYQRNCFPDSLQNPWRRFWNLNDLNPIGFFNLHDGFSNDILFLNCLQNLSLIVFMSKDRFDTPLIGNLPSHQKVFLLKDQSRDHVRLWTNVFLQCDTFNLGKRGRKLKLKLSIGGNQSRLLVQTSSITLELIKLVPVPHLDPPISNICTCHVSLLLQVCLTFWHYLDPNTRVKLYT